MPQYQRQSSNVGAAKISGTCTSMPYSRQSLAENPLNSLLEITCLYQWERVASQRLASMLMCSHENSGVSSTNRLQGKPQWTACGAYHNHLLRPRRSW